MLFALILMLEGCWMYLTLLYQSDVLIIFSLALEEVLFVIIISFNQSIIFVFLIRLIVYQALRGRITCWIPLSPRKTEKLLLTLMTARRRKHIMKSICSLFKHRLFPRLKRQRYYICHVFACILKRTNGFYKIIVFSKLVHHASLFQELVVVL